MIALEMTEAVEAAPVVEWVMDDAAHARARAALDSIDRAHEGNPKCVLCGHRANRLDKYGLCSKVSDRHKDFRAEARKADAR